MTMKRPNEQSWTIRPTTHAKSLTSRAQLWRRCPSSAYIGRAVGLEFGRRICFLGLLGCLALVSQAVFAAAPAYEITIRAGAYDRINVPVMISIPDFVVPAQPVSVQLTDANGTRIPAQLTGPRLLAAKSTGAEIHFILNKLNAGQSMQLKATFSNEHQLTESAYVWRDKPGLSTELHFGNRPILRYHYEQLDESTPESRVRTYKPFHHVFSPLGDRIVTNGLSEAPNIHSPHHRGIYFGFNRITYGNGKKADTWHCIDGAYQEHKRILASEAGPVMGRHRVVIGWHGNDEHKQPFAEEQRELAVYNVSGGHLIEFASRMKTTGGRVRLDGDPQHAGFQFRAHNDVDVSTTQETIYVRTDGVGKPGDTRNWEPSTRQGPTNLPWNAMSFVLGGKRYTMAYLDRPQNPKEARFSERNYGRFGSYFEYTLDEGTPPLEVNYRLWLQYDLMAPADVAKLSRDFVEPIDLSVRTN